MTFDRFRIAALALAAACTTASSAGVSVADEQWHLRETRQGAYRMTVTGDLRALGSSVSIRADSASARAYGQAEYVIPIRSASSQRISVTADVRPRNVRERATIWIRADRAGTPLLTEYAQIPARGTSEWQHQETGFVVPANASSIAYGVLLEGSGEVSVRNITVESTPLPPSGTPMSLAARAELDSALHLARHYALWRDTINWSVLEGRVRQAAAGAREPRDVYAAIRLLAASLGDHHSSFYTPTDMATFRSGFNTPAVDIHAMAGGIGYVNAPGYLAEQRDSTEAYVRRTYVALEAAAPRSSCGWVVDLRENTGGAPEPMFAALAPFLDMENSPQVMRSMLEQVGVPVPRELHALSNSRIAVLVGPQTGSAGERLALALRRRPFSRFFGQPTAGVATARRMDILPDGAALAIATSPMDPALTRNSTLSITPDVVVREQVAGDPVLKAATGWISATGCVTTNQ